MDNLGHSILELKSSDNPALLADIILLQEQVQSLTSSSALSSPKPHNDEVETRATEVTAESESAPSFTRRARQQQPAVVA